MTVYLDASVVGSVILRDLEWEGIVDTIGNHDVVALSDFALGEIVSSIAIRNRASGAALAEAEATIADLRLLVADWLYVPLVAKDIEAAPLLCAW